MYEKIQYMVRGNSTHERKVRDVSCLRARMKDTYIGYGAYSIGYQRRTRSR